MCWKCLTRLCIIDRSLFFGKAGTEEKLLKKTQPSTILKFIFCALNLARWNQISDDSLSKSSKSFVDANFSSPNPYILLFYFFITQTWAYQLFFYPTLFFLVTPPAINNDRSLFVWPKMFFRKCKKKLSWEFEKT